LRRRLQRDPFSATAEPRAFKLRPSVLVLPGVMPLTQRNSETVTDLSGDSLVASVINVGGFYLAVTADAVE
jgi:hypothetical protein